MDTVKLCCNDGDTEALTMWLKYNQKVDLNKPYSFKGKQRDDDAQSGKQLHTTYLITAARNGYTDIIKVLLDFKAEVDLSCDGVTALSVAISRGHLKTTSTLISAGAKVNWDRDLKSAARKGDVQMIELLQSYAHSSSDITSGCKEALLDLCRAKKYVDDALVSVLIGPLLGQPDMLPVFKSAMVNHRFHIANVIMTVPMPQHNIETANNPASCTIRVGALSPAQLSQLLADMICDGSATDKQVSYLINKGANVEFLCSHSSTGHATGNTATSSSSLQTIKQYVMASDRADLKKLVARAGESPRVADVANSTKAGGDKPRLNKAPFAGKAPVMTSSAAGGASTSASAKGQASTSASAKDKAGSKTVFSPKAHYMLKPMADEQKPFWGK